MKIVIPLKLPSLANARLHWRALSKIKKQQKLIVGVMLHRVAVPPLPVVVKITRVGKRKLDGDNLQSAGKFVRDEIAKKYKEDDGSDLYTWVYEQRIGKEYAVEIEIKERS